MTNTVKQTVVTSKPTTTQIKTEITTDLPDTLAPLQDTLTSYLHSVYTNRTAIMSSQVGSATKKVQSEAPETPTKASKPISDTKLEQSAPRSVPDIDDSESQSQADASNSGEGDEGEMVPAAGRINEKGEVIDDDGNAIGKVTNGNAKDFVDFIVTQEGDILDSNGGVVGKAEPLEDVASDLAENYTTTTRDHVDNVTGLDNQDEGEKKDGEEKSSGVGSVLGGVGNLAKGAVSGVGKTAKGATGAVGDTTKGVTDTVGDATGTQDVTDKVGDTVKGTTDTAGETTEGATDAVGDVAKDTTDTADDATKPVTDKVDDATGGVTEKVGDTAGDATDKVGETADDATDKVGETAEDAKDTVDETTAGAKDTTEEGVEGAKDTTDETTEGAKGELPEGAEEGVDGAKDITDETTEGIKGELPEGAEEGVEGAKDVTEEGVEGDKDTAEEGVEGVTEGLPEGTEGVEKELPEGAEEGVEDVNDTAEGIEDEAGEAVEGAQEETDSKVGDLEAPIEIPEFAPSVAQKVVAMFEGPFRVSEDGQVQDQNGKILGKLADDTDLQNLIGKDIKGIDENGNLLGDNETVLGKVDLVPEGTIVGRIKEEVPEAAERLDALDEAKNKLPNISILEGLTINKVGNVVNEKGNVLGRVVEGSDLKKLVGKQPDAEGKVWDNKGNVIGEVEVLPEADVSEDAPFQDFPDAIVDKGGIVVYEGRQVGVVIEGDHEKLIGKKVDSDGDILDKNGNVVGKAERKEAEEAEPEAEPEQVDYSVLKDKKVNKLGNVVDDKGTIWGRVVSGILQHLIGKKVGSTTGEIFNDAGKVIGKAEPVPDEEREEAKEPSPFEDFPNATVGDAGKVLYNGEQVGVVVEGDHKKLKGKTVDPDGDILDKNGNTLGHAERWEPEEEEPEAEIDNSALAGKRINKAGNAVDSRGEIFGRVKEGDLARLIGKMCDKHGFIRNEGGDVIGKAELIPEAEREGLKEGPFTELSGCTVNKEGHVVTPGGDIVGRLTTGDAKTLAGRAVDDDGDILDKNGNVLGHAERWEPEEKVKDVSPLSGRKVNKEGNVVDENGDLIGKLTSGDLSLCAGKKVDDDGDVIDQKGTTIGHVSLLEDIVEPEKKDPKDISPMSGRKVNKEGNVVDENGDILGKLTSGDLNLCTGKKIDDDGDVITSQGGIVGHCTLISDIPEPEPEPEQETEEQRKEREKLEKDREIAGRISACIQQSLDRIRPICKQITDHIDRAERTDEAERDEEQLVRTVKPLIEEGGKILTEANGVIRGLDPDGRISETAKGKAASREATPEEYHLAELLKELTGTVTETIENGKRRLEDMKYAKKQINPLWGLLSEPLAQIIAAVGLLLSGVLGLVGKLLNGLGLGGILNGLLGGLGITKVLDGLGLGSIVGSVTGQDKKKGGKSGGGGLLGGIL